MEGDPVCIYTSEKQYFVSTVTVLCLFCAGLVTERLIYSSQIKQISADT